MSVNSPTMEGKQSGNRNGSSNNPGGSGAGENVLRTPSPRASLFGSPLGPGTGNRDPVTPRFVRGGNNLAESVEKSVEKHSERVLDDKISIEVVQFEDEDHQPIKRRKLDEKTFVVDRSAIMPFASPMLSRKLAGRCDGALPADLLGEEKKAQRAKGLELIRNRGKNVESFKELNFASMNWQSYHDKLVVDQEKDEKLRGNEEEIRKAAVEEHEKSQKINLEAKKWLEKEAADLHEDIQAYKMERSSQWAVIESNERLKIQEANKEVKGKVDPLLKAAEEEGEKLVSAAQKNLDEAKKALEEAKKNAAKKMSDANAKADELQDIRNSKSLEIQLNAQNEKEELMKVTEDAIERSKDNYKGRTMEQNQVQQESKQAMEDAKDRYDRSNTIIYTLDTRMNRRKHEIERALQHLAKTKDM